jgi:hypothetical protein
MTSLDVDQIKMLQQSASLEIQSHETNFISGQAFEEPRDREYEQMEDSFGSDANQQIIPPSDILPVAKKKRSKPLATQLTAERGSTKKRGCMVTIGMAERGLKDVFTVVDAESRYHP